MIHKFSKLNRKDIINYSMFFAVFLVILSTFDHSFNIKILINFFLLSIIIFWLTNNIYRSMSISFIITFIYYITNNGMYETFDNKDLNVNDIVKELTNISKNIHNNNEDTEDAKDDKKEITEDDINLLNDDDDDDKTPNESNKYMESAKAQRETFRLINTIKQLDDTVKNLAPTLKQGANIIEKFKKLNLIVD